MRRDLVDSIEDEILLQHDHVERISPVPEQYNPNEPVSTCLETTKQVGSKREAYQA
jgi:hypothetical protein